MLKDGKTHECFLVFLPKENKKEGNQSKQSKAKQRGHPTKAKAKQSSQQSKQKANQQSKSKKATNQSKAKQTKEESQSKQTKQIKEEQSNHTPPHTKPSTTKKKGSFSRRLFCCILCMI